MAIPAIHNEFAGIPTKFDGQNACDTAISVLRWHIDAGHPGIGQVWRRTTVVWYQSGSKNGELGVATGTVKWFDPEKGFGFIAQDDGGADLFVHRSAVGFAGLNDGDKVEYEIGYGPKGENATDVTVTEASNNPPRPRRDAGGFGGGSGGGSGSRGFGASVDVESLPIATGTVKRYDPEKGFGFIAQDAGGDDVFVHRSAVGYEGLNPGDRVEFRLGMGPKGARAEQVKITERGASDDYGYASSGSSRW